MMPEPYEIQINKLFTDRGWTLSAAESCTGGAVSAMLTAVPGASRFFLAGIVAYANEVKTKTLGVAPSTLKEKGTVSEETVKQMVEGVLNLTGSDFGMAVSGIAGPDGGTAAKPVGTVWCAFGRKGKQPVALQLKLEGSREQIILGSANALLDGLLRYAQQEVTE